MTLVGQLVFICLLSGVLYCRVPYLSDCHPCVAIITLHVDISMCVIIVVLHCHQGLFLDVRRLLLVLSLYDRQHASL